MNNFTSAEWILIIGSLFTGIVSVIGAIKSNGNSNKLIAAKNNATRQDEKLDTIHAVANGNLERAMARIVELTDENTRIKLILSKMNEGK